MEAINLPAIITHYARYPSKNTIMIRTIHALLICLLTLSGLKVSAQATQNEKPSISVTGTADREVVPDEIYLSITLHERYEGKEKIDIEAQENQLISFIKGLGIDPADLSLSAADEIYKKMKFAHKDDMESRNYQLKVGTAAMASKVLDTLGEMKVTKAAVVKYDYSKKKELKRELEIEAMIAAQSKARNLLGAIGQAAGKPIHISETSAENTNSYGIERAMYSGSHNAWSSPDDKHLEFRKIKFSYSVMAKFEIN